MNKWIIMLFVLLSFQSTGQAKQAAALLKNNLKKYPFQSGEITYQISGDLSGEERLVFDAFGWQSFRTQTLTIQEANNVHELKKTREIINGEYCFKIYEDSTFSVIVNKKWSTAQKPQEKSTSILSEMGGTQLGDSTIFDKTCRVWHFENKKTLRELWVWNGLVLKRKENIGDLSIVVQATEVELDIPVNTNLFIVPEKYKQRK